MSEFVRGYADDAGVDIILDDILIIKPGFQKIDLNVQYTPAKGETAFLISRGSTANKGIFPLMVAIDAGFEGNITAWVMNLNDRTVAFDKGDRAFGIVNLKLGEDRVKFKVLKEGKRGTNKLASTGGNNA